MLLDVGQDGGAVTAGNSSPITDGACALVVASASAAAEMGLPVLAVVRGYGDANQDPQWFTTAPAAATPKVRRVQLPLHCQKPKVPLGSELGGVGCACSKKSESNLTS
jgi:3-oxoacyl-(acyl-carrier-protein) synthase